MILPTVYIYPVYSRTLMNDDGYRAIMHVIPTLSYYSQNVLLHRIHMISYDSLSMLTVIITKSNWLVVCIGGKNILNEKIVARVKLPMDINESNYKNYISLNICEFMAFVYNGVSSRSNQMALEKWRISSNFDNEVYRNAVCPCDNEIPRSFRQLRNAWVCACRKRIISAERAYGYSKSVKLEYMNFIDRLL